MSDEIPDADQLLLKDVQQYIDRVDEPYKERVRFLYKEILTERRSSQAYSTTWRRLSFPVSILVAGSLGITGLYKLNTTPTDYVWWAVAVAVAVLVAIAPILKAIESFWSARDNWVYSRVKAEELDSLRRHLNFRILTHKITDEELDKTLEQLNSICQRESRRWANSILRKTGAEDIGGQ